MQILIYAHSFAPKIGGAETYVMLLAKGLAERGEEVTVVTPTPSNGYDDLSLPFRVVRQPNFFALLSLLRKTEVIQLAGPCFLPLVLGLLLRKRVVIEHHGYQAVCPNGLLFYEPSKKVCPNHFIARRYHLCLKCNSVTVGWGKSSLMLLLTFLRRWLCGWVVNIPVTHHVAKRLHLPHSQVIYHGIPDTGQERGERGKDHPVTFAYVGRLVSEKGLPLLLQSARQMKKEGYSFILKFIGDGPERAELERRVREWDLTDRVEFTGFLTGEILQAEVLKVDAVIMPSIWEETAGLSAMEQMMRGQLVIAADIGGLGEVVDGVGLKFPPGDEQALTSCLRQVLEEPEIITLMGRKAREKALQKFQQGQMVEEHLSLYRRLRMK